MNRWFRPLCRFRAPALKEALLAIQYLMPTEYTVGIKQSQLNYLNYGHKLMWDYIHIFQNLIKPYFKFDDNFQWIVYKKWLKTDVRFEPNNCHKLTSDYS